MQIAVVRIHESKTAAVYFDAEGDFDDCGLVDESWRRRQEGTLSLYRYCRFSLRLLRKELLQQFEGEGLKVHEWILLRASLRTLMQMLS
jgi:hypothetical protein